MRRVNMRQRILATLLAGIIGLSPAMSVQATNKAEKSNPYIESTGMKLESAKGNKDTYTQKEWEEQFPEGTFILEYSEYTAQEGGDDSDNPGDSYLAVNVIRMGGNSTRAEVQFGLKSLTAREEDYEVANDTLTFEPGEEVQTAYVKIIDNQIPEHERFLSISLMETNVGHIGQMGNAMICIKDNEVYVPTELTVETETVVDKSLGKTNVILRRAEEQSPFVFTVDVKTKDKTAKAGVDYLETSTTVAFGSGEMEKTVEIPLLQTQGEQAQESLDFDVQISNPKGGTIASGSEVKTVAVTDKNEETTNPIHNTELMLESMGKNDQTEKVTIDDKDVTENLDSITLNENADAVDNSYLLRNAVSAFSGVGEVQPFGEVYNTTWGSEEVIFKATKDKSDSKRIGNPGASGQNFSSPTLETVLSNSSETKIYDDGVLGINDDQLDVVYRTTNKLDMNKYSAYKLDHSNNGGSVGMYPITAAGWVSGDGWGSASKWYSSPWGKVDNGRKKFNWTGNGITNNSNSHRFNTFAEHQGKFSDSDEVTFSSLLAEHTNAGAAMQGSAAKNSYFYMQLYDGANVQRNEYRLYSLTMKRAYIPFSKLFSSADGFTSGSYTSGKYKTTDKDGNMWETRIDGNEGGFASSTGIYVGSKLNITITPQNADASHTIFKSIRLANGSDKEHFSAKRSGINSDGGIRFSVTLETKDGNGVPESDWLSSVYESSSKTLKWGVVTAKAKSARVNIANASEISKNSGILTDFMNFGNNPEDRLGEVGYNAATKEYKYGLNAFSELTIDFSKLPGTITTTELNDKFRIKTNIAGYETEGKILPKLVGGKLKLAFANIETKDITVMIIPRDMDVLNPNYSFSNYAVEQQDGDAWNPRVSIPFLASELPFEAVHEPVVDSRADAFSFDIKMDNTRMSDASPSQTYKIGFTAVQDDVQNPVPIFEFEHDSKNETPNASAAKPENESITSVGINLEYYQGALSKPEVKRISRGPMETIYRVYIPSIHNYISGTDKTLLKGPIRVEVNAYKAEGEVAATRSGHLIRTKMPNEVMQAEEQGVESNKVDGQENLYVYKDNTAAMELPSMDFDLGGVGSLLGEYLGAPVSGGPALSIGDDQIEVSFSINGEVKKVENNVSSSTASQKDRLKSLTNQTGDKGLEPLSGTSKSAAISVGGGFSITMKYNANTSKWEFKQCYFVVSASGGFTMEYPLPPAPIVSISFGAGGGLEVGSGFESVPMGMKNGQVERKIIFSGITMSPSAYISLGIGVGIPNIVSITISGFIRAGLTSTFAKTTVTENFGVFDVFTGVENAEFQGTWAEEQDKSGAFQNTLMTGDTAAVAEFNTNALKFELTGKLMPGGGTLKVSVYDKAEKLIEEKEINTDYTKEVMGARLFTYRGKSLEDVKIKVEVLSGNVSLDAMHYETDQQLYTTETVAASLDAWHVKIGVALSVKVLVFEFNLDLLYYLLNEQGMAWGYPGKEHQIKGWDATASSKRQAFSAESPMKLMDRNKESNPLLYGNNLSTLDYFDFGDGSDSRTKEIVDESISATTLSDVIAYKGSTYKFWIDDAGTTTRPNSYQRNMLYYQVDDGEIQWVEDDGTLDVEFQVGVNADGKLKVTWSSYKEGISMPEQITDMTEQMRHINNNIEIKTAVLKEDNTFGKSQVIKGTDDERNDTNIKQTSNSKLDVVTFVKDKKGSYDADTKIKTETVDQAWQDGLEDFMNAIYQGIPTNYIAVTNANGETKVEEIKTGLNQNFWKVGTMITSTDIAFVDEETVALSYIAEVPNAQKNYHMGKNNLLFMQYGKVQDEKITFGEPQLVQEVFNYDEPVANVFGDQEVPDEYLMENGSIEDPIISQPVFKKIKVPTNAEKIDTNELTFFYKMNDKIHFMEEATIRKIAENSQDEKTIQTIKIDSQYYDINVSDEGKLYIVYAALSENGYDNQLMVRFYDEKDKVWSKSSQITYGHAFDEATLQNQGETGQISFHQLSTAMVTGEDGKNSLKILTQAGYAPFSFTSIKDLQGNDEIVSYVDEASDKAVRNLVFINTGEDKAAITGSALTLDHEIFIDEIENKASFTIENVGAKNLTACTVEVKTDQGKTLYTQSLDGSFLSGDKIDISGTFLSGNDFSQGETLYYEVTGSDGASYSSLDKEGQFHVIEQNKSELLFGEHKVEWEVLGDANKIQYTGQVNNIGHVELIEDVKVLFEVMRQNPETFEMEVDTTKGNNGIVHEATIAKENVDDQPAEMFYNLNDSFDVPADLIQEESIIRMRIEYGLEGSEYNKFNNISENITIYPPIKIVTGFEEQGNILNVSVGEEIELAKLALETTLPDLDVKDIEIYEVDSNYLSIDDVSAVPRIKVMSSPEEVGVEQARVAFRVKKTAISKTVFLNISDSEFINFAPTNTKVTVTGDYKHIKKVDPEYELNSYENLYEDDYVRNTDAFNEIGKDNSYSIKFNVEKGKRLRIFGLDIGNGEIKVKMDDGGGSPIEKTADKWLDSHLESKNVFEYDELNPEKSYAVTITCKTKIGERSILDYAMVDGAISNLPETEAYGKVDSGEVTLDAPLQNGRNRKATMVVTISEPVVLKDGVNKEDLFLNFAVREKTEGSEDEFSPLPKKGLKFESLSEDGKTITFSAEDIVSAAGKEIAYQLEDLSLPKRAFVAKADADKNLNVKIPSADKVSFKVTESKIEKVELIKDQHKKDTVGKGVVVTFEKSANKDRLQGTSIQYKDEKNEVVSFSFVDFIVGSTTKALYRTDATLDTEVLSRTFTFDKGIELKEDYALISAEGHFIDGTISAEESLNFTYEKVAVAKAPTLERVIEIDKLSAGERIASNITFNHPVSLENIQESGAYVVVTKMITNSKGEVSAKTVRLVASEISKDNKTIRFISADQMIYNAGDKVNYVFGSERIQYENASSYIVDKTTGILINPAIDSEMIPAPVSFVADANILGATLGLKDGYAEKGTIPVVKVDFNTEIFADSLQNATITIKEVKTTSKGEKATVDRLLTFAGMEESETPQVRTSQVKATALFAYQEVEAIELGEKDEEIEFLFEETPSVVLPDGETIWNKDQNIRMEPSILSSKVEIEKYKKVQIEKAELTRTNKEDKKEGNVLTLKVTYSDKVTYTDLSTVTIDLTKQEVDKVDSIVTLTATKYDEKTNTLTLVGEDSIYTSGKSVAYILADHLMGSVENIVGSDHISASTYVEGKAGLTMENTDGEMAEVKFDFAKTSLENPIPQVKFTYERSVSKAKLKDHKIKARGQWFDEVNKEIKTDEVELSFDKLENEDKTLVYNIKKYKFEKEWLVSEWIISEDDLGIELMDKANSMKLGTTIPTIEVSRYSRPKAKEVLITKEQDESNLLKLEKLGAKVTFDKPVVVEKTDLGTIRISGTMKSTLSDKARDLQFVAVEQLDEHTLRFACESKENVSGTQELTVRLGSDLEYAKKKNIFDADATEMLVYGKLPESSQNITISDSKGNANGSGVGKPKTGDRSNMMFIFLFISSTLALGVMVKKQKRTKNQ